MQWLFFFFNPVENLNLCGSIGAVRVKHSTQKRASKKAEHLFNQGKKKKKNLLLTWKYFFHFLWLYSEFYYMNFMMRDSLIPEECCGLLRCNHHGFALLSLTSITPQRKKRGKKTQFHSFIPVWSSHGLAQAHTDKTEEYKYWRCCKSSLGSWGRHSNPTLNVLKTGFSLSLPHDSSP